MGPNVVMGRKGPDHIPDSAENGAIRHAHRAMSYIGGYPPPPPPKYARLTKVNTRSRLRCDKMEQPTTLGPNLNCKKEKKTWSRQYSKRVKNVYILLILFNNTGLTSD